MVSTLKEAMLSLKAVQTDQNPKVSASDGLLGKYAEIAPAVEIALRNRSARRSKGGAHE